jgi:hypothetical protein
MTRQSRTLPLEFVGEVGFGTLIDVLGSLAGEEISVNVTSRAGSVGVVDVFGLLAEGRGLRDGSYLFTIGEAAWVRLDEREIARSTLATRDGNFYFRIAIELSGGTIVALADRELQGLTAPT